MQTYRRAGSIWVDAADVLGVSVESTYRMKGDGLLTFTRVRRRVLVHPAYLQRISRGS